MWRVIVSVITAIGAAIVARTYSEKPDRVVVTPGAPPREAGVIATPDAAAAEAATEAAPVPQPGWSLPKPEVIPRATYWPVLLAGGVSFVFWGLISDIWIFGTGLILTIMSMIGWVNDLLNE
jgi:hypothetical protein